MTKETTSLKGISTDALISELRNREDVIAVKVWERADVSSFLKKNHNLSEEESGRIAGIICNTTDYSDLEDCDDGDWELLADITDEALKEV